MIRCSRYRPAPRREGSDQRLEFRSEQKLHSDVSTGIVFPQESETPSQLYEVTGFGHGTGGDIEEIHVLRL